MAQSRVTDFFTSRKRNLDVQPSKRRKVVLEDVVESVTTIKSKDRRTCTRTTTRSSSRVKAKTCEPAGPLKTNSKQCTQPLSSALDSPGETILSTKSSKSTSKAKETTEKCKTDILLPAVRTDVVSGDIKGTVPKDGFPATLECEAGSVSTAACDNHSVSPSSTPTKRRVNNKTVTVSTKRSRVAKTARRDLLSSLDSTVGTQEKGFNFKPFTQSHGEQADSDELGVEALSTSPRKKLQPHRRSTESSHDDSTKQSSPCKFIFRGSVSPKTDNKKTIATEQPLSSADDEPKVKGSDTSVKEEAKQKVTLTKLVKSTSVKATEKTAQPATKVLPSTEATAECTRQVSQVDNCSLSSETKEKKPTKEVNVLKLDAASFREKLAGCGQLSQLKERLAEFGKVAKATREIQKKKLLPRLTSPTKSEISKTESENKTPAYERFHSLAAPVPPSLTLPYHYKILDEMFRGVDTVVSMLHQRSELCTFTKLKTAVQQMVRRTFDVKNLGRIKTVYPTAYTFRQEKGLPCFGGKTSGYQLTLEAILEDKQAEALKTPVKSEKSRETKKEKFTAADLLERKAAFHRGLIDIVKKHHKEFLATLDRPLDVPDDKITRWHPKFRLDEVPAVEPSPLPLPPDTTTFTTAKDVLEQAKNKFTPSRVQRALEIVSAMSPNKKNVAEKTEKSVTPNITPKKASNSSKNSLEGVPQSLLERIRAKEVKKLEHEMMRTPAQARHIDAISRLPELVRILRTFIVTQKKIAVPVDDVVQKLSDSYKTSLGIAESERHLKLMVELLPEWIQMVTVKKGSFIKIDKNRDVQQICAKLQKILKQNS